MHDIAKLREAIETQTRNALSQGGGSWMLPMPDGDLGYNWRGGEATIFEERLPEDGAPGVERTIRFGIRVEILDVDVTPNYPE